MTRMQNRKLRCFKDENYMAELKEWWMDAQDDVTDCFEYSECNLNAKIINLMLWRCKEHKTESNSLKSKCKITYLWDLIKRLLESNKN